MPGAIKKVIILFNNWREKGSSFAPLSLVANQVMKSSFRSLPTAHNNLMSFKDICGDLQTFRSVQSEQELNDIVDDQQDSGL